MERVPHEDTRNWGSHLPVLIKLMQITSGDILEIGAGLYSTPFFHWASLEQGRKIVSVENSEEYTEFASRYAEEFHTIVKEIPEDGHWDIVFIDSFPHEDRRAIAHKLADRAKYIVVHDYDGREDWRGDFKYFLHYTVHPETAIFSNTEDLSNLKIGYGN